MQRPTTKERARYRSQGSNGNGYQACARRTNPSPQVGALGAVGAIRQRRCGVPCVVARRIDLEMSPDEITNLIEAQAGDSDGDPGRPTKAMFLQDHRRNGCDRRPTPHEPEPRDELGNDEARKPAYR
jgi:hypothetical protein